MSQTSAIFLRNFDFGLNLGQKWEKIEIYKSTWGKKNVLSNEEQKC